MLVKRNIFEKLPVSGWIKTIDKEIKVVMPLFIFFSMIVSLRVY